MEHARSLHENKQPQEKKSHPSIHTLLGRREFGLCSSCAFDRSIGSLWEQQRVLLKVPEIASPHRFGIRSLSFDRVDGRFLLCGSSDATISIYDLSKWGSEEFVRKRKGSRRTAAAEEAVTAASASSNVNRGNHENSNGASSSNTTFRPIAQSLRVPSVLSVSTDTSQTIPHGHSSSLTHVQWYPVDTGAFVSASMDGTLLVWDTNRMQPVFGSIPFRQTATLSSTRSSLSCVHLGGTEASLVAAASWNECHIKLVDLRSGASTHELIGHDDAVSCIQWSPTSSVVLASGSRDGTLRLWDIRKSGSRSCITQLHPYSSSSSSGNDATVLSYSSDYAHLNKNSIKRVRRRPREPEQQQLPEQPQQQQRRRKRRVDDVTATTTSRPVAPNNYNHVQSKGHLNAHNGVVSSICFFPTGHFLASVGGKDGELLLWDLRHPSNLAVTSKFVGPDDQTAAGMIQKGSRTRRKIPLMVDTKTSTIWVGHNSDLLGFHPEGGIPKHVLKGHLHSITAIESMNLSFKLITGSADGMILTWGKEVASARNRSEANKDSRLGTLLADRDNWDIR